jgi:ribosome-associated toxin RatA of RatAB toxin-antitoxin module
MGKLFNEVIINAPLEKVWDILADVEQLGKYDPTVKKAILVSKHKTGLEAKRKIEMLDGKNWFEEKITVLMPHKALSYQLTDCSFPIKGLKHSYSFEELPSQTKVRQIMEYSVKFGLFGKLLDSIMIRKQFNAGIKKFFSGLKSYAESN